MLHTRSEGITERSADEVRACVRLVLSADVQLVTLTGAPGVGKTWLASAVASTVRHTLPDGAVTAELAELENWVVFLAAVAEALDLPDSERTLWSIKESLKAYLRNRTMLLVLDTFEHLLPAAPSVRFLLDACPNLTILVTSRRPLGFADEHLFTVSALPLPDLSQSETLSYNEGVALFARSANLAPAALRGETAQTIAQLCHRLDGLPLAVVAAARQLKRASPQALLQELEYPAYLNLWTMNAKDAHHRSLFEAVRWSYVRLSAGEQGVLKVASLLEGPFERSALASLLERAAPDLVDQPDTLTFTLEGLLSAHLIEPLGIGCYRLLHVIRSFLRLEVDATGERPQLERAYKDYLASTSEPPQPEDGPKTSDEAPGETARERAPEAPKDTTYERNVVPDATSSSTSDDVGANIDMNTGADEPDLFLAEALTERELDVLKFVAQGLSNREVAEQLDISHRTVSTHLSNVYSKLGVSTRTAAASRARRLKLIE